MTIRPRDVIIGAAATFLALSLWAVIGGTVGLIAAVLLVFAVAGLRVLAKN